MMKESDVSLSDASLKIPPFPQLQGNCVGSVDSNQIHCYELSQKEKVYSEENVEHFEHHNKRQLNGPNIDSQEFRPENKSLLCDDTSSLGNDPSFQRSYQSLHVTDSSQPQYLQQAQLQQQYQNGIQNNESPGGRSHVGNQVDMQHVSSNQSVFSNTIFSGTSTFGTTLFTLQNQKQSQNQDEVQLLTQIKKQKMNQKNQNHKLDSYGNENSNHNSNDTANENQSQSQNRNQINAEIQPYILNENLEQKHTLNKQNSLSQNMLSYRNGANSAGVMTLGIMPPVFMNMLHQQQHQQQQYETTEGYMDNKGVGQSQENQQHVLSMAEYLYAKGDVSNLQTNIDNSVVPLDQENQAANGAEDVLNFDNSQLYLQQIQQQYQQFYQMQQLHNFQQFQQLQKIQQFQSLKQFVPTFDSIPNSFPDPFNIGSMYQYPNEQSTELRKQESLNSPTTLTNANAEQNSAHVTKCMTADNLSRTNSSSSLLLNTEMFSSNNFAGMFSSIANTGFDISNGTGFNSTLGRPCMPMTVFPTFTAPLPEPRKNGRQVLAKSKNTSNDPSNPKRFRCAHCTWSFTRQSDLRRHLKSHNKPQYHCPFFNFKYYTCSHRTDGSFNRLDVLKRHLKLVHFIPDKAKKGEKSETIEKSQKRKFDSGMCLSCSIHFDDIKTFILHVPECAEKTPMKLWRYKRNGDIITVRKYEDSDELKLRDSSLSESIASSTEGTVSLATNESFKEDAETCETSVLIVSVKDIEEKPEEMKEALSRRRGRPKKCYT
ncbi:hypothetical protein CANINC_000005 [Pichia inconspicua]|uniref:C2H2-type domain-containing protein n=1 Tax=Pichia inconspicua TaxID=52247 RepID=A0A4T0X734_9ASCO|nr:hypothetical protein CANINC_000005 [[Candida] inconspicua]